MKRNSKVGTFTQFFMTCLFTLLATGFAGIDAASKEKFKAEVIAELPDVPEGIAQDAQGRIYVTVVFTGEVVRLTGKGRHEHIAWLPSYEDRGKGAAVGLEVTAEGNLIVAYVDMQSKYSLLKMKDYDPHVRACKDSTDQTTGVYKIIVATGEVQPLATKAQGWPFCLPDDIAIDRHGNIYVSDLTFSGIWKLSPDGKNVTLFSADRLLQPGEFPTSGHPLGINVVALSNDQKTLYGGTTGTPMVIAIPINEDGTAGQAYRLASGFAPIDGIAVDEAGNIYISEAESDEITVLSPDGKLRITIANRLNAPLHTNTSLLYDKGRLCTTNLGVSSGGAAPKTVVCISGFPRPSDLPSRPRSKPE